MSSNEVNMSSTQLPTQQTVMSSTEVNMSTTQLPTQQYRYFIIDGRIVSAIVGLFIVGLLKKFLFD